MGFTNVDRLEQTVRDNIERLCRELFPLGVRDGAEWKTSHATTNLTVLTSFCPIANREILKFYGNRGSC
jgi:hypothetical protein